MLESLEQYFSRDKRRADLSGALLTHRIGEALRTKHSLVAKVIIRRGLVVLVFENQTQAVKARMSATKILATVRALSKRQLNLKIKVRQRGG